jgi:ribokinase
LTQSEDRSDIDVRAPVPEFLAFGDLGVDSVAFVDHLPQPDEKIFVEPGGDFSGGMMGNVVATVAALGVSAGVVALLGKDDRGDLVFDDLAARGVDVRYVRRVDDPTFWTLSLTTPSGDRALVQFPTPAFFADWEGYDRALVGGAKWIHTTAEQGDGVTELFRSSRRTPGATTSLDIEYPFVERDDLPEILQDTDVAFVNRAAAVWLGGIEKAAARLQEWGVPTVLVTLGAEGCVLQTASGAVHELPAFAVDPIDTNGAGDAFAAGFAAARLRGLDEEDAAQMANVVAALSTRAMGGHGDPPSLGRLAEVAREAGYTWGDRLS